MSNSNNEFMKQIQTGSIGGDEDYIYEQWSLQQDLTEGAKQHSIFPDGMEYDDEYYKSTYTPTPEEEELNHKQNGL